MDQYLIFQNGEQKGPFTLLQLRAMWSNGAITVQTLYWQEGQPEWLPLESMLHQLENHPVSPAVVAQQTQVSHELNKRPLSTFSQEVVLWKGRPAYLNYFGSWAYGSSLIFLGAILVSLKHLSNEQLDFFPLLLLGLGVILILRAMLDRVSRLYTATNLRVSVQSGLIVKSTNEVRIRDIRSINVTKSFISGLLGIGHVEFSSAASDKAEIVFAGISEANKVRDLVRQIQG